jgi:hypothetical protein
MYFTLKARLDEIGMIEAGSLQKITHTAHSSIAIDLVQNAGSAGSSLPHLKKSDQS